ncbi:MAG: glycosyl hydrolase [Flavobacteriia bacterium]|jgi:photosystem II stability/assembly factor-like uncharacterized protein
MIKYIAVALTISTNLVAFSQKKGETKTTEKELFTSSTVSSLAFRNIGPALTSGRIIDLAIHPTDANTWYVAAACGGVWKTENHGTTFSPIFDSYGSYSIGCVEIAPSNHNTVWVGSGENNNQRSVAYGDGVYRSLDGGKSFENMGLKKSEHIGSIVVHPTNENIVWVAAYGPVWSAGGERGVYKTIDGGKTWERTLFVSDDTGINEVIIDPTNPDVLYAAAHQRRRHEFTYIGGGPESTVYKSIDGGKTWKEIASGFPKGQMGRIGLAISPADHNYVYAIVEARNEKGGVFKSTNRGESWEKQSSFSTSGNYYQEIMCDPLDKNKVFAMDTYLHHSTDGGKNFDYTGEDKKHVDNHAIWVDPTNTNHWLVGCDGGLYETFTHAKEWKYFDNLPIIQYYKVATDNASPFYNVYGGTQDNNSHGGPSGTINNAGILNSDWFITNGGDGFESAIDPTNPNIVYAQAQYGWLIRYDKQSGEKVAIQPLPKKGEEAYRWNWDAPLFVSPHDPKTLYFAANKVFKTTNMGDDWEVVSPDLTQQIDRDKLPVMGQVWSVDAVMKNASTTIYGNIVALDESPKKKGLLYAGTDDGCIQVSQNEGANWTKITTFPGIPANTRVNMLMASVHDENTVYACFNNQRQGDFKPYLMRSADKGKTWTSISGNLPERGTVYCVRQDHVDANLLFVGTEFGAYFSNDGGKKWTQLGGLPTIAIYDLDIQKRENDLVAASFGRGFYVLDNYAPLRELNKTTLGKKAHIFPVKDALLYVQSAPLGESGVGSQGADLWTGENPAFGATFHLYMKDSYKTLKQERQEKEKTLEKDKKPVPYPTLAEMRAEENDEAAKLIVIIRDDKGNEVKRLLKSPSQGIQRITWNLRDETTNPIQKERQGDGFLVVEGNYTVEVLLLKNGTSELLVDKTPFKVKNLNLHTMPAKNQTELLAIRKEVSELSRQVAGARRQLNEKKEMLDLIEQALKVYPNTDVNLLKELRAISLEMQKADILMNGDKILAAKEMAFSPSINDRLNTVEYQLYESTTNPTKTQKANLEIVKQEYTDFQVIMKECITRLRKIEDQLDANKIPYTKGKSSWKE